MRAYSVLAKHTHTHIHLSRILYSIPHSEQSSMDVHRTNTARNTALEHGENGVNAIYWVDWTGEQITRHRRRRSVVSRRRLSFGQNAPAVG